MIIVLISNTCSPKEYVKLQQIKTTERISPQQNYFSMLIDGLLANPDVSIKCITARAIAQGNTEVTKLTRFTEEINDRLCFYYTEVVAKNVLRNIKNYLETKELVKKIIKESNGEELVFLFDPLSEDTTIGGLKSSRYHKKIAVITDIPIYISEIAKEKITTLRKMKYKIKQFLFMKCVEKMDGFCFLTKNMEIINHRKVPTCIVEGMIPDEVKYTISNKQTEKTILLYAGGLYANFGIKDLIEAFLRLDNDSVELHLYGEGNCVGFIKEQASKHKNIIYKGVVGIDEIKEAEKNADLLINPRPVTGEFTEYSFPSKTLEYISSGRPVVTTKLAGIPDEYFNYLYLINNAGSEGIYETISDLLKRPKIELNEKGKQAFEFAKNYKRASIQAQKIYDLFGLL